MELFGLEHLLVIACTALAAAGMGWAVRARPSARLWRPLELAMGAVLIGTVVYFPIAGLVEGSPSAETDLPLHASDVSALLASVALFTKRQLAFELAWFWVLSGGVAATLTPDLDSSFPEAGWWVFVLAHSLAIVSVIELGVGRGMRPRRWSAIWAAGGAVVLLAIAGTASALTGGNYMFTREPPGAGTPLDAMGGWPWYLFGGALIALAAFALLEAPFRLGDRRRRQAASL